MKKETWEKIEKEFDEKVAGRMWHLNNEKNVVLAYEEIKDFFRQELEAREKEILEEIINKIDTDYKGRDITIYELGDWLNKNLKELEK